MKLIFGVFIAAMLAGQPGLSPNDGKPHGEQRFKLEAGWTPLLNGSNLSGWHGQDGEPHEWFTAKASRWDGLASPTLLSAIPAPGGVILNSPKGKTANLVSDTKFGDVELHVEFMTAKGSNSGVYMQGLYEVQILDSYGKDKLNVHDCGSIYERWIDGKGVGGSIPLHNACRPPGEWQSFDIWYRAPRFDSHGNKIANAKFLRVLHNEVVIQENVESEGPTRAAMNIPEAALNPLMLQGNHGPVAFRNIYVRPLHPLEGERK